MLTRYTLYPVSGPPVEATIDWPRNPDLSRIRALVEPMLGNEPMEHVSVLHSDRPHDMFASEVGHLELTTRDPLLRNEAATTIYRNFALTKYPKTNPETLSWIAGPAVLFHRIIWT
jgi:hypothetical protein